MNGIVAGFGKKYQGVDSMSGKIRQMIDCIMAQRAKGNPMLERAIKSKLILKGINPAKYTLQSDDNRDVIGKLEKMMQEFK